MFISFRITIISSINVETNFFNCEEERIPTEIELFLQQIYLPLWIIKYGISDKNLSSALDFRMRYISVTNLSSVLDFRMRFKRSYLRIWLFNVYRLMWSHYSYSFVNCVSSLRWSSPHGMISNKKSTKTIYFMILRTINEGYFRTPMVDYKQNARNPC